MKLGGRIDDGREYRETLAHILLRVSKHRLRSHAVRDARWPPWTMRMRERPTAKRDLNDPHPDA